MDSQSDDESDSVCKCVWILFNRNDNIDEKTTRKFLEIKKNI